MAKMDILQVNKGDVVRFSAYALRVEAEPIRGKGSISLTGRISIDGCPIITKRFLGGRVVEVERK